MKSALSSYSTYKPSGVSWLGDVPAHWEVRRTKALLKQRNLKGFPDEPLLAATQTKGVVRKEDYENRTVLALKDLHLLKLVRADDFVISLRSFQGGIEFAREQGIISPAYTILFPRNPDVHPFLAWLFKSRPYIENLTLHVTGIRQGQTIDYSELSRSNLPLPPLAEQRAIVRYLDHVDRRIRRYVGAKRKLIGLLEEEKQAVINQAVTRGLEPSVPLKPSGVEWLRDVPEHWEVRRLKQVSVVQTGITLGKNYRDTELIARPYLRVANVQSSRLDLSTVTTVHVPQSEIDKATLRFGDVLMTEGGDIDKLGRGCVWSEEIQDCLHQNHVFAVRPNRAVLLPEFLVAAMGSSYGRTYFQTTAKQTTNLASTNRFTLGNFFLLLPDAIEQQSILDHVADRCECLDSDIARTHRQIELIEEYRTRLIADVVTGKLDVREAAGLPDEPDGVDGAEADGLPVTESPKETTAVS